MKKTISLAALLTAFGAIAAAPTAHADCNFPRVGKNVVLLPSIYIVYWGWGTDTSVSDPSNEAQAVNDILPELLGSRYMGAMTVYAGNEYGTTPGLPYYPTSNPAINWVRGTWTDNTNPLPTNPTPEDSKAEARAAQAHFGDTNPDTIYLILRPKGSPYMPAGSGNVFCAIDRYDDGGSNPPALFIDVPYIMDGQKCTSGDASATLYEELTLRLQHEFGEELTDPRGQGINDDKSTTTCGEIGDPCAANGHASGGGAGGSKTAKRLLPSDKPIQEVGQLWNQAANGGAGACVYSYSTGYKEYYVYGIDHSLYNGSTYIGNPGVDLGSDPGSVSWGPRRSDVFMLDTANPPHMRHAYTDDDGQHYWWDDWGTAGGNYTFSHAPDVASWGKNRLDVFAVASNWRFNDTELYHFWWDNGAYASWESFGHPPGANIASGPGTVSPRPDRIDTFVVSTRNHLWRVSWDASRSTNPVWDDWGTAPDGATLVGDPDVASWGPNRLDVFVRSDRGTLEHAYVDSADLTTGIGWDTWSGPVSFTGNASVYSLGDERLLVGAPGTDGNIWLYTWDWGPGSWAADANNPYKGLDLSGW